MTLSTSYPRYLTLAEAGEIAHLSVRTLRRAIQDKHLHAYRPGRLIRIELTELERWIKSNGAAASRSR
jgi:excisionase family DNA binding protein